MSDSIESLFSNSSETDFILKIWLIVTAFLGIVESLTKIIFILTEEHDDNEPEYAECISTVKHLLSLDVSSISDDKKAIDTVSQAVEKCYQCIHECINNIKIKVLEQDTEIQSVIIRSYLSDLLSLLQLLIQFLEKALDVLTAEYQDLPNLPKTLNLVLILVFSHCKDSESMYGEEINAFGDILKDLFKTCHELQVACFVIMDKHFVFDVSNENSFADLTEVLDLCVDIGDIVLDLDIKTMAEQWKGYVALCEKYAHDLIENYTFDKCITIFCKVITDNVATLLLDGSDQNLVMRCLKVSSFLMKILIKLCQVFDKFVLRDYNSLIKLLMTLMGLPESYLRVCGKSEQLIQKLNSYLGVAAVPLLLQLMANENCATDYFNFNLSESNQNALGYLMLSTNIIKTMLERDTVSFYNVWLTGEKNVLCNIFKHLPKCHTAFSLGLSLECRSNKSTPNPCCSVFEYVVLHAGALAATLGSEGFVRLEEELIKSVMQEDFWQSTFATDLWCIVARFSPPELCLDQVTFLIETYYTIINLKNTTPVKIHLASTIHRLFNLLLDRSKCQVLEQFPLQQGEHRQVWSAIELSSLPDSKYEQSWRYCVEELKCIWEKIKNEGCSIDNIHDVIGLINLVSTGAILDSHAPDVREMTVDFWHILSVIKELPESKWERPASDNSVPVELGLSVCSITVTLLRSSCISNEQLVWIFDIILTIIKYTPASLKLGILSMLDTLAVYEIPDDSQTIVLCQKIARLFETLLTDKDRLVCSITYIVFYTFSHHTNRDIIVSESVARNKKLKKEFSYFVENANIMNHRSELSIDEQLKLAQNYKFVHKCNPATIMQDFINVQSQSSDKSNTDFDIGDIDMLFMDEIEETSIKKTKHDDENKKIEEIIRRLDSDSSLLANICRNTELSFDNKSTLNAIISKIKMSIE